MPSTDKWYACKLEASKPENQEALRKLAEGYAREDLEAVSEFVKGEEDGES